MASVTGCLGDSEIISEEIRGSVQKSQLTQMSEKQHYDCENGSLSQAIIKNHVRFSDSLSRCERRNSLHPRMDFLSSDAEGKDRDTGIVRRDARLVALSRAKN